MKTKSKKILTLIVVVAVAMLPFCNLLKNEADGISKACESSEECVEAARREEAAKAAAVQAASTANAYQRKVDEISANINEKQAEIAKSERQIVELKTQIAQREKEIKKTQAALAELLVNMHFESDAEPIKILAGASSISDLAEKAAREEVAKEEINAQANKIKKLKQGLEDDKAEIESQLAAQQMARKELEKSRAEQAELVAKYENDVDAYEAVAAAARAEKQSAEAAWQEAHQSTLGGLAYYSGDNTYPWQADCPGKQDWYTTSISGHAIGGYVCECVSYVGWKAYEAYGMYLGWGNAYSWDDVGGALGYRVDHSPEAGTIGQVDGGAYGHVFWVESVNSDGSVNVTEYNNAWATYLYAGSMHYGDFGARTIPAGEASGYNYIHLR